MSRKVLFIWYKNPEGILEGGGQVSTRNFRAICSVVGEENVTSYYIHDSRRKTGPIGRLLKGLWFPFRYFYGLTPSRVRKMVEMAREFDVVFIDRSVFGILARELKRKGYAGRVITFFHNVEETYFDARLSRFLPLRGVVLRCVRANDGMACRYSDAIATLTSRDSDVLHSEFGRNADAVVPVSLPDRLQTPVPEPIENTSVPPLCLFLGAYFRPNNEAVRWFAKEVLPHVDIRMRVVGRDMDRMRDETPEIFGDVEVFSSVPDLLPYLMEADIVILPVFAGSGMKVKTCEALMYGRNILGTDEAFAGYSLEYGEVGGLCNTAADFIKAIRSFCDSPRPRFNEYSRRRFLDSYSNEAQIPLFAKLIL